MFGGYHQSFLERHEGFSMLLLEGSDAGADERAFVRAQIAASPDRNFGTALIFEPAPLSS